MLTLKKISLNLGVRRAAGQAIGMTTQTQQKTSSRRRSGPSFRPAIRSPIVPVPRRSAADALRAMAGRVIGLAALRAWSRPPPAVSNRSFSSRAPTPRTPEQPLMKELAGVVHGAVGHGERAQRYHDGAARRIDAALYELDQLRMELAAVLSPELLDRIMTERDPSRLAGGRAPSLPATAGSPIGRHARARPAADADAAWAGVTAVQAPRARSAA